MSVSSTSLAEQTQEAVSQWLKASLQFSSATRSEKRALEFAIEMVSISAAYVIQCAESKKPPTGKGLSAFLVKKSATMAKMVDYRPLQCVAAVADFGVGVATEGPRLIAGFATAATGVTLLLALQAGLSLLLQANDVWDHCAPVVRRWVEKTRREIDLERIHRQAMGKLEIYALNYEPDSEFVRIA